MDNSPAARLGRFARAATRWASLRLTLFVVAVLVARQLPGPLKGPAWLLAFSLGFWAFPALVRASYAAWDVLVPRLGLFWKRQAEWVAQRTVLWGVLSLLCGLVLAGIAIHHAWPAWHFLATSSLREDEILNIQRYTSKGFAPAVGSYDLARNHIFFNVVNALLPGADSLSPFRGRLVSLIAVSGALVLIVLYAIRRGWFLAGVAFAGFVAIDLFTLKVLLEGRGYGLICFFGTVGCIALCEGFRTRRPVWLAVLGLTTVLGTYTLPYYVIFGGGLMLAAYFQRPSRETFLPGMLTVVAIAMLYLPVIDKVFQVASGYEQEYGDSLTGNFGSIGAVYVTLQYLFSFEVTQIGPVFFLITLLLFLLFMMFGQFARRSDRQAAAGVAACFLGMMAFLLFLESVPIRVSAFLAGPLAFLATVMTGSVLAAKALVPVRPLVIVGFTALAGTVLWKAGIKEPLLPRQNWADVAQVVERAFPADMPLWTIKKYAKLMRPYLPEHRIEEGELEGAAFAGGNLLVFDSAFKGGPDRARFAWDTLPAGVRYITAPLLINYHRLFFLPPTSRGIHKADVAGREIPFVFPGRQPRDPALLSVSWGDGDELYRGGADEPFQAEALPLPGELTLTLEDGAPAGSCNVLFSQTLADKLVEAEVQGTDGIWRTAVPFVLGEFVSVPLAKENCRAVRLRLAVDPEYKPGPNQQEERPALALIDAWVTRQKSS
jgi:hypothetical protein